MKTSEKEVKLLIVLLVIMAGYAFYSFLLKPQMQLVSELQANVAAEDTIVRNMYIRTLTYPEDVKTIQTTSEDILENISNFYTSEQQEVFLNQIDQWLADTGLTYASITSQEPTRYILSYVNEDETSAAPDSAEEVADQTADGQNSTDSDRADYEITMTTEANRDPNAPEDRMPVLWSSISIEADGKYSNAMRFLDVLTEFEKDTIAYEMTLEAAPESLSAKSQDPDVKLKISLYFLNLTNPSLCNFETSELNDSKDLYQIPEMPSTFVMPPDFISGAYREPFSFAQIVDVFRSLVSRFIN